MAERSGFRRTMEGSAWGTGVALTASILLHRITGWEIWDIMAITAGTAFFHVAMRLAVGNTLPRIWRRPDPAGRWFREKPWERALYRRLHVRRWKGRMPTYDPDQFRADRPAEELLRAMCVSEAVHAVHAVLSLLPVGLGFFFGAWPVFILTSLAASAFDLAFVAMQRYNRPRVMRLAARRDGARGSGFSRR